MHTHVYSRIHIQVHNIHTHTNTCIHAYTHTDDMNDADLMKLIPILDKLENAADVRTILRSGVKV